MHQAMLLAGSTRSIDDEEGRILTLFEEFDLSKVFAQCAFDQDGWAIADAQPDHLWRCAKHKAMR